MNNTNTMTVEVEKKEVTQLVASVRAMFEQGKNSWQAVGDAIVELLDVQHLTLKEVERLLSHETLTHRVLAVFERIGRKMILPQLAGADFPASKFLECLPLSEQRTLLHTPLDLVVSVAGEKFDVLPMEARDLNHAQCQQVFGKGMVRSAAAQRAWIAEKMKRDEVKKLKRAAPQQWEVIKGEMVIYKPCVLTKADLLAALGQMK